MSAVKIITSLADFHSSTSSPTAVSLLYATAAWCGPCKVIAPTVEKLAVEYQGRVSFLKFDVDATPDVAEHFAIRSMPTFIILKGQNKVEQVSGGSPPALIAFLKKNAPASAAASSSGSGSVPEKGLEGFSSLKSLISTAQTSCLNEAQAHTVQDLLKEGGDKWLESDSDEQLLLHISMIAVSRVRAIRFTTLPSAIAHAPKTIRVFVNNPSLGFDDADSLEAAYEVELSPAQASGVEAVQLRFVRFQTVSTLSIFVKDNQGDEEVTRLDKIDLIGISVDQTNMSDFKSAEPDHEH